MLCSSPVDKIRKQPKQTKKHPLAVYESARQALFTGCWWSCESYKISFLPLCKLKITIQVYITKLYANLGLLRNEVLDRDDVTELYISTNSYWQH